MKKLIKREHKLKKLQIKLPNILISLHREHNKRTLTKAKEDNMLCKQYGHNFKLPLIDIKNISCKKTNNNSNISHVVKYRHGRNLNESINIFND